MNHILYNISIIMLLLGIIFLTYYLTKAYNKPICYQKNEPIDSISIDESYNMRPSQIFDSMFTKPDIWQGYESVTVKHNNK